MFDQQDRLIVEYSVGEILEKLRYRLAWLLGIGVVGVLVGGAVLLVSITAIGSAIVGAVAWVFGAAISLVWLLGSLLVGGILGAARFLGRHWIAVAITVILLSFIVSTSKSNRR